MATQLFDLGLTRRALQKQSSQHGRIYEARQPARPNGALPPQQAASPSHASDGPEAAPPLGERRGPYCAALPPGDFGGGRASPGAAPARDEPPAPAPPPQTMAAPARPPLQPPPRRGEPLLPPHGCRSHSVAADRDRGRWAGSDGPVLRGCPGPGRAARAEPPPLAPRAKCRPRMPSVPRPRRERGTPQRDEAEEARGGRRRGAARGGAAPHRSSRRRPAPRSPGPARAVPGRRSMPRRAAGKAPASPRLASLTCPPPPFPRHPLAFPATGANGRGLRAEAAPAPAPAPAPLPAPPPGRPRPAGPGARSPPR